MEIQQAKRYFRVPAPVPQISLFNDEDLKKPPVTLKQFVVTMLRDAKFGANYHAVLAAQAIFVAIKGAEFGDTIELAEAHWQMLKGVIESPTGGYDPHLAILCLPHMRALLNASTEPPDLSPQSQ